MALTPQEQRIFDRLQMRLLATRQRNSNRRSAVRSPMMESPKEEKTEQKQEGAELAQMKRMTDAVIKAIQTKPEAPVVNVTVEPPEIPESVPVKIEKPVVNTPKRWVFKHKYDVYNKLIETTATAE